MFRADTIYRMIYSSNSVANKLILAILKDEYGGAEGIVTLEDLIEEIVWGIEDESDITSESLQAIDETHWKLTGYGL